MSENVLRAGVIGGGLGGSHGYAYARAAEYDLVAICDLDPDVFARFYERAELPQGSLQEYTDYHEMFEQENLTWYQWRRRIICTPTQSVMPPTPASKGSSAKSH